jgi:hypothetical protein
MNRNVVFGGVIGGILIVAFSIGLLLIFNEISVDFLSSISNVLISGIIILLAPIAGGFVAGKMGVSNPRQAGSIAGLSASLILAVSWLIFSGFNLQNLLTGLVLGFMWIVLARLASGFARPSIK